MFHSTPYFDYMAWCVSIFVLFAVVLAFRVAVERPPAVVYCICDVFGRDVDLIALRSGRLGPRIVVL